MNPFHMYAGCSVELLVQQTPGKVVSIVISIGFISFISPIGFISFITQHVS